jgi:hypothetical protein
MGAASFPAKGNRDRKMKRLELVSEAYAVTVLQLTPPLKVSTWLAGVPSAVFLLA